MESGGGGLVSTTMDYARFCQMLLNGGTLDGNRIIGRKTLQAMASNHLDASVKIGGTLLSPGHGFGLGFAVRTHEGMAPFAGSVGQFFWSGMAGTFFWIDPAGRTVRGVHVAGTGPARISARPGAESGVRGGGVRLSCTASDVDPRSDACTTGARFETTLIPPDHERREESPRRGDDNIGSGTHVNQRHTSDVCPCSLASQWSRGPPQPWRTDRRPPMAAAVRWRNSMRSSDSTMRQVNCFASKAIASRPAPCSSRSETFASTRTPTCCFMPHCRPASGIMRHIRKGTGIWRAITIRVFARSCSPTIIWIRLPSMPISGRDIIRKFGYRQCPKK